MLGVIFTCVQVYEYAHAPFGFKDSIFGATFFMATGFHGFHVVIGTIFLGVCLIRAYLGHFTPKQHLGFEFAAWYWHFVGRGLAVPVRDDLRVGLVGRAHGGVRLLCVVSCPRMRASILQ